MTSEYRCFVFVYLEGALAPVPAGALTLLEEGTRVVSSRFGYGKNYLGRSSALPVDPVSLPLQGAVAGSVRLTSPVNGLDMFGAFRDAMPDSWGRRVIENKLKAPPNSLPESTYLESAGSNRLGALDFRPDLHSAEKDGVLPPATRLSYLLEASDRIQRGEPIPERLMEIFDAGPTMGGMRPKAVVVRDEVQYIAKFPALHDRYDLPAIERATLELARECGLNVPATDLVTLADGRHALLVARFDRTWHRLGWQRAHVVSALTLLGLHETESRTASYADISHRMTTMAAAGTVASDRTELFKRMVFNILVSNDDDHLRNHAFIWSSAGQGWRLSPLYDVVPKPQVATERFLHLGVGSQGRLATLDNAASRAAQFGLHPEEAVVIIRDLSLRVREWRMTFERWGVSVQDCDKVVKAFQHPRDLGLERVEAMARGSVRAARS